MAKLHHNREGLDVHWAIFSVYFNEIKS